MPGGSGSADSRRDLGCEIGARAVAVSGHGWVLGTSVRDRGAGVAGPCLAGNVDVEFFVVVVVSCHFLLLFFFFFYLFIYSWE